jgi:hypothetical protein
MGTAHLASTYTGAKNLVSLPPYGTFILLKNSGCEEDAELMTFRGDMQI